MRISFIKLIACIVPFLLILNTCKANPVEDFGYTVTLYGIPYTVLPLSYPTLTSLPPIWMLVDSQNTVRNLLFRVSSSVMQLTAFFITDGQHRLLDIYSCFDIKKIPITPVVLTVMLHFEEIVDQFMPE